jgi:hypothetical protein
MFPERFLDQLRQQCHPVLESLAVPYRDLVRPEVDVLDPEPETFPEPEAGPIHKTGHYPHAAFKAPEYGSGFLLGHDDRQALWPSGPNEIAQFADLAPEQATVEKQNGAQSLILGGGTYFGPQGQVAQESIDLGFTHIGWVTPLVKVDEPQHPVAVGLLGAAAIVSSPQNLLDLPEQ